MKLWDKGQSTHSKIDDFTVGKDRELDLLLAKYDVIGSKAHAKMLSKVGLISNIEFEQLDGVLNQISQSIKDGDFSIEESFEDVHSKIEWILTKELGDLGKKIHTGRSRNDQVLVDIHLYLKEEWQQIYTLVNDLFTCLMELAEQYKHILLPGYTHLQVAMPSSFGMWFSAYAESLIDDVYMLNAVYSIIDQNPLGSAAGYGSSFPLDRTLTTELLGFKTLKYNSVSAQMNRGKLEKNAAFAISSLAGTLSKLSMDICLYLSQNFNFISFPDQLTTGSSIMPHKKNPDVFELIRGKCNRLQALPNEIALLTTNLPSGYHRDMQLLKECLLPNVNALKSCLEMMIFSLAKVEVKNNILKEDKYQYIFSVEKVNELVKEGFPFRDAYKTVGETIENGSFKWDNLLDHSHIGSLGNLCLNEIRYKMKDANVYLNTSCK